MFLHHRNKALRVIVLAPRAIELASLYGAAALLARCRSDFDCFTCQSPLHSLNCGSPRVWLQSSRRKAPAPQVVKPGVCIGGPKTSRNVAHCSHADSST